MRCVQRDRSADHHRVERRGELFPPQGCRRAERLIAPLDALRLPDRRRAAGRRVDVQLHPRQARRELRAEHRRDHRIRALERPEQAHPHHDAGSLRESSHARNRCPAGHGYPADMLTAETEYVLRTIEERNIRFVRLWFTDVRGFLKAFTITSQELEGAFYDGPELEYFYFKSLEDPAFLDQGGYFDETPLDVATDYRKRTVQYLESMGIPVEYVHHEVAPSQHEIDLRYTDALTMADNV